MKLSKDLHTLQSLCAMGQKLADDARDEVLLINEPDPTKDQAARMPYCVVKSCANNWEKTHALRSFRPLLPLVDPADED